MHLVLGMMPKQYLQETDINEQDNNASMFATVTSRMSSIVTQAMRA